MSQKPVPAIPPRPARSPRPKSGSPSKSPQPARSKSREPTEPVDAYAPSPLNVMPEKPSPEHEDQSNTPNVKIPTIGQEGVEYADYDRLKAEADAEHEQSERQQQQLRDEREQEQEPAQTRNVAQDLKVHAPRPASGNASSQLANVTKERSRDSAPARPSLGSRPVSLYSSSEAAREQSTEPGFRVPMYPGAGDVQAPTPRPESTKPGAGGDFARPPDTYGLHSHDNEPISKLDEEWYKKHPEAQEELHNPRPENAFSREELNRIVRDSAKKDAAIGTTPQFMGTPDEEMGYRATEELVSHLPQRPTSLHSHKEQHAQNDKEHAEDLEGVSVHVDEPVHRMNHADGYVPGDVEVETEKDTQQQKPTRPSLDTRNTSTDSPVLAADELRKPYHIAHLQAAVSPTMERRSHSRGSSTSSFRRGLHHANSSASDIPFARKSPPKRVQPAEPAETRPKEDVKPLFPEDEEDDRETRLDRFKNRPELLKSRFPSKDVWEDSPDSAYLEAVVDAPANQPEGEKDGEVRSDITGPVPPQSSTFETPQREEERIQHAESPFHASAAEDILHKEAQAQTPSPAAHPEPKFPSKDIWEDAPDSSQLVATIEAPEEKPEESPIEPNELPAQPAKPVIPVRPAKRPTKEVSGPVVAPAPAPVETKRSPPTVPDRPKPQVPARPARRTKSPLKQEVSAGGGSPLARTASANSANSGTSSNDASAEAPAKPKTKPAVPARPVGSKIAALQAGFLSDLNNRLRLGGPPPPPKPAKKPEEEEKKEEPAPLADARKGRARGPARRKPAAKPAAAAAAPAGAEEAPVVRFEVAKARSIFEISPEGVLSVGEKEPSKEEKKQEEKKEEEKKEEEKKEEQEQQVAEKVDEKIAGFTEQVLSEPAKVPEAEPEPADLARAISSSSANATAITPPAEQGSPDEVEQKAEAEVEKKVEDFVGEALEPAAETPSEKGLEKVPSSSSAAATAVPEQGNTADNDDGNNNNDNKQGSFIQLTPSLDAHPVEQIGTQTEGSSDAQPEEQEQPHEHHGDDGHHETESPRHKASDEEPRHQEEETSLSTKPAEDKTTPRASVTETERKPEEEGVFGLADKALAADEHYKRRTESVNVPKGDALIE